jgi:hypothetical protein
MLMLNERSDERILVECVIAGCQLSAAAGTSR